MATEVKAADRAITVSSIVSYFTDEELNRGYHSKEDYQNANNKYGVIYKLVSFSDTTESDKLKEYARKWILRNYYDGVLAFTIKAVDLYSIGYLCDKIFVGDRIRVQFKDSYSGNIVTRIMTCLSAQYDIMKPENSTFKIGIPDVSTNIKYRDTLTAKSTTKTKPKDEVTGEQVEEQINDTLVTLGLTPGDNPHPILD